MIVSHLITLLAEDALVVPGDIETASDSIREDPSDEAVLACALDSDLVVSGDRHFRPRTNPNSALDFFFKKL